VVSIHRSDFFHLVPGLFKDEANKLLKETGVVV
jgi:hypothetical protein